MSYRPIRNSGQLCPAAVRFQSCAPPADLGEWLQEFWQYDVLPGFALVPIQVFPSGCVVLRFDVRPDGVDSILYPPSSSPEMKSVFRRGVSVFGAALRVGRACPVLGCGIPELGSRRIGLDDVWSRPLDSLEERLFLARGFPARVEVLAEALRPVLDAPDCGVRDFGPRLDVALSGEDSPWARRRPLSDRTLRRHFGRYVGHSPKQLQRIVRVQSAMRFLAGSSLSLTQVAHASGFSDQSHLNREFVRLVSMTPGFFRRSLGRFHEAGLPIWAEVPFLRELGAVPSSGRPSVGY